MIETFEAYIAIGDSMSINKYPVRDIENRGDELVSKEIGAAALLYLNEDGLYPEFEKRDLETLCPGIAFENFTEDGYTTEDILEESMSCLEKFQGRKGLITLTAGGNDLLSLYLRGGVETSRAAFYEREMKELQVRYDRIISKCMEYLPSATIILTTVYDPTDGTGKFPGNVLTGDAPIEYLIRFNDFIHQIAKYSENLLIADVYSHFLNHGIKSNGVSEFWYWMPSPIEPGAIGASEIRRVWLNALQSI